MTDEIENDIPMKKNGNISNKDEFDNSRRFALADLLRDCAAVVENNEMDQKVFQDMFLELTAYVKARGDGSPAADVGPTDPVKATPSSETVTSADASTTTEKSEQTTPKPAVAAAPPAEPKLPPTASNPASQMKYHTSRNPDPPGMSQAPAPQVAYHGHQKTRKVTTTTKHIPQPPSSTSSRSENTESALAKEKAYNLLGKIKSNVKEMGHEFTHIAHTGQRALSQAAKNATSHKNAQRVKADIASELHGDEWCEEHFTKGCACKLKQQPQQRRSSNGDNHSTNGESSAPRPPNPSRPPFQRPVNPNSTLIANGWLEQQRRSKMRTVWKEVLVSLVAGRRPGEETTLWVQREAINPTTGTAGLEALHQIPIKGIQDVNYVDFSVDNRFVIQVYNLSDEFIFRTRDNGDAAKNWVSTLRLTREAILNGVAPPKASDLQGASHRTKTYPGYSEDEKKAESPPQQQYEQQQQQPHPRQAQQPHPQPQTTKRLTVKDLRAIAHGHGINTAGMERGELEAVVAKIQQQNGGRVTPHPPAGPPPPSAQKPDPHNAGMDDSSRGEAQRRSREEQQQRKEAAELRAMQMKADEEAAARLAAEEAAEAERRRKLAQAEEERRRAEEERRRAEYMRQQEIHRQQQAQEAAKKKWEEDQRKAQQAAAAAEAERRRYQQQQQYYAQQQAQQQAQWNQHHRQHQQQQQQQQQHAQWNQQPHARPHGPSPQAGYPQGHAGQQQQQQQHPRHQTPPPPNSQGARPPPPGQQQASTNKWVNMAAEDQTETGGQAKITSIKHDVLVKWALQPPNFQMLRSIEALLTTIHTVFPPNLGVPAHDYFKKWKVLTIEGLSENGRPEEGKLAKAVKKLRFFLHPDKLPRDLNEEQSFLCKMAWDITNDAWEEYEKRKDDLDWLNAS